MIKGRPAILIATTEVVAFALFVLRRTPVENPFAPSLDDLEQAYRQHDPRLAGHQRAEAVVVTPDGITVLCNRSPQGGGEHTRLVQLDQEGALRWEKPIAPELGTGRALVELTGGGFAVAAARARSTTDLGMTSVLALAADRGLDWRTDLPVHGRGEPAALTALPGGDLAMVGHRPAGAGGTAGLWVARLPATTGEVRWEKELVAAREDRRGRAVTALEDGGMAIAGDASRQGRRGLRAVRLAADGNVLWERWFEGGRSAMARGLARTDDGGLVLVGSTTSEGADRTDARVLRLGGDGSLVWGRVLGAAG